MPKRSETDAATHPAAQQDERHELDTRLRPPPGRARGAAPPHRGLPGKRRGRRRPAAAQSTKPAKHAEIHGTPQLKWQPANVTVAPGGTVTFKIVGATPHPVG